MTGPVREHHYTMNSPTQKKDPVWVGVGVAFGPKTGGVQVAANLVGGLFTTFYFSFLDILPKTGVSFFEEIMVSIVLFCFLVVIGYSIYMAWFRDIRAYIRYRTVGESYSASLEAKVQKKVLNLPIVTSLISIFNWTLAATAVALINYFDFARNGITTEQYLYCIRLFTGVVIGGVVTSATIFFVMETYCRRYLHHFFPKGGMVHVKGVFRLNLKYRILITFVFASFIPITDMALMSYTKAEMMLVQDPQVVLDSLGRFISFALAADLFVAFLLSHLLSKVIVSPVMEMKHAMARLEKGDLNARVRVCDNNELGILGNNFNRMTRGIKDWYHMRQSLAMAREVQQGLLPSAPPEIEGLDIAGKIIYSDETGGDYYDYIQPIDPAAQKIGIAVGDVSEHGIPSAILMASTRAFIRQRAALEGDIATLLRDVNYQFTRDVEDSGRFMTLFFLSVEYGDNLLRWVRAGHDAAILYDPVEDRFEYLQGKGVALGINGDYPFSENVRAGFEKGQVIVLGTDGLWEATDSNDVMFGKERIETIVRESADQSARSINRRILSEVTAFSKTSVPEDDITLVVVKRV